MPSRLDPAERDRRAAERRRATFSGERYRTYDTTTGFGSEEEWAKMAAAFIKGEKITFDIPKSTKKHNSTNNPFLDVLGFCSIPNNLTELKAGYRKSVMKAFLDSDSKDTSPEYVRTFRNITTAFEQYKKQRNW